MPYWSLALLSIVVVLTNYLYCCKFLMWVNIYRFLYLHNLFQNVKRVVLCRYVEFHFERYSDAVDSIVKLKELKEGINVRHQKPFETHGLYINSSLFSHTSTTCLTITSVRSYKLKRQTTHKPNLHEVISVP